MLGRTQLEVPAIGMGTWRTFDTSDDRTVLVGEALGLGMNLFDSSPMYGRAEDVLAQALGDRRGEALIATKIWTESASEGRRQAEHALALFGHVDIYQVHNLVSWADQLTLLEALKSEGKVTAVGATHHREGAFDDLIQLVRSVRLEMVQIPYNPLRRQAENALLPATADVGAGVLVMSPFGGDILRRSPSRDQLKALRVQSWPEAILKWIVSDQRVSCVLTATHSREHLAQSACAGDPPWFDDSQRNLVVTIATG